MVCTVGQNVIACGPPAGVYKRRMVSCPECNRTHRFVVRWDGAWYGNTYYGSCGDTFQDGSLGYRPAKKGWRDEAKARFRAMWDNAAPVHLYEAYVDADVETACAQTDEDAERAFDKRDAAHRAILEARAS